jgi:hypothetical protein
VLDYDVSDSVFGPHTKFILCQAKDVRMAQILIRAGANVGKRDSKTGIVPEGSPMLNAIGSCNWPVAKLFLNAGASPHTRGLEDGIDALKILITKKGSACWNDSAEHFLEEFKLALARDT